MAVRLITVAEMTFLKSGHEMSMGGKIAQDAEDQILPAGHIVSTPDIEGLRQFTLNTSHHDDSFTNHVNDVANLLC